MIFRVFASSALHCAGSRQGLLCLFYLFLRDVICLRLLWTKAVWCIVVVLVSKIVPTRFLFYCENAWSISLLFFLVILYWLLSRKCYCLFHVNSNTFTLRYTSPELARKYVGRYWALLGINVISFYSARVSISQLNIFEFCCRIVNRYW